MRIQKLGMTLLFLASLIVPVFSFGTLGSSVAFAQNEDCPPPDVIEGQRELLENLREEYVAIRAYKDATLNELARQNARAYGLRAILLRSLIEREALIQERDGLVRAAETLTPDQQERLRELEDQIFELGILLETADGNLKEQIDLVKILWRPVLELVAGVGPERYERYTQRILEVRRGEGLDALAFIGELLNEMLACSGLPPVPIVPIVPIVPGQTPIAPPPTPIPSGV